MKLRICKRYPDDESKYDYVYVEDLRAWLLKKEEEENNERDRPHVKDNHFANARIDGEMYLIRELLAELEKEGK